MHPGRRAFGIKERSQFFQGSGIHGALEIDDLSHRLPILDPPPLFEFRGVCFVQAEGILLASRLE
jgi:hypothetical protein